MKTGHFNLNIQQSGIFLKMILSTKLLSSFQQQLTSSGNFLERNTESWLPVHQCVNLIGMM